MDSVADASVEADERSYVVTHPPWWRVLITPWFDLFHPYRAAANMAGSSLWAFWWIFVLHVLLLTGVVVWLALWAGTVETYSSETPVAPSAQNPAGTTAWTRQVVERTYAEVWDDWQRSGTANPATFILCFVPVIVVVCTAFGAWLHLITVHVSGSAWKSYRQSWRCIGACLGLLALFTLVLGTGVVTANNQSELGSVQGFQVLTILIPAFPAAACCMLMWIGRAMGAVQSPSPEIRLQPRCEGCGYDLTHVPDNGLCPECGREASSSLTPNVRRPGSPWENAGGIPSWFATSANALLRPREFYGKLQLHTGEDCLRPFTRWHFLGIGAGASIWIAIAATASWYGAVLGEELLAVSMMVGFLAAFMGWVVHRTVGAAAGSVWLARGELADFSWVRKVLAYETVFLWAFCLFNGLLMSSFMAYESWISSSAGSQFFRDTFRMPGEVAAVIFGNVGLVLLWWRRYRIILRAIRWSNF